MRSSTAATCGVDQRLATMNCSDSGRSSSNRPSTTGMPPPISRTLRQPQCGISQDAPKPPAVAPSVKPISRLLQASAR